MLRTRRPLPLIILLAGAPLALLGCRFLLDLANPAFSARPKPIFLWFDPTADVARLGSTERLTHALDLAVGAGVTGVIIDVKPISGHVLFDSDFAPRLERWPLSSDPETIFELDTEFDLLAEACRLGHERGLDVFAGMNVFAEGDKRVALEEAHERGRLFADDADWAAWDNIALAGETQASLRPTTAHSNGQTAFASPLHPEVRAHALNLIREVVARYPIDGIVLDSVRFDGLRSDFSPWARHAFENWIGSPVTRWPADVCTRSGPAPEHPHGAITQGPLWDQWLLWRALTLHDFMIEANEHVKLTDPSCAFAARVDARYLRSQEVGMNWASPRFRPPWREFPRGWRRAGCADQLDFLFAGGHLRDVSAHEGGGPTVESSLTLAKEVVDGECPVIAGLCVEASWLEFSPGEFDREQFARALRSAHTVSDGLMIFDLTQLDAFDAWDIVADFTQSLTEQPTSAPSTLSDP
jgi:uncharacterized lipoprotein YddW (UPF0748 family)